MKINIYKAFCSLFLCFALSSCNLFLEVNPDNRTESNTKEKIQQLLVSAYPNANACMIAEHRSDNILDAFPYSPYPSNIRFYEQLYYFEDKTDHETDRPADIWRSYYAAIAHSNQALLEIKNLGNPKDLEPQRAEALVTRAYAHFLLVNLFCIHYNEESSTTDLGIPYIKEPETSLNPKYERGTVKQVYELIEKDLMDGLPFLDDSQYKIPAYHFRKNAANAFAARFFLYYGKFEKAIEHATNVLGAEPKNLLFDWETLGKFRGDPQSIGLTHVSAQNKANLLLQESVTLWPIFSRASRYASRFSHTQTIADEETLFAPAPWGSSPALHDYKFPPTSVTSSNVDKHMFFKFPFFSVSGNIYTTFVNFKTDETLLVRAEAKIMLNKLDEALEDMQCFYLNFFTKQDFELTKENINDTYRNMPYATKDKRTAKMKLHPRLPLQVEQGTDKENFVHTLLHMRRVLTLYEGLRWFDMKRYGIEAHKQKASSDGSTRETILTVPAYSPLTAVQIPAGVISAGMKPNPR